MTKSASDRTLDIIGKGLMMLFTTFSLLFYLSRLGMAQTQDLTEMSIEELMNIQVTSVSKKAQHLSDSAAAIFVITNDDLRKSGVTSIADALRMVPGLNVTRIDSNKWAINSRSSTSRFSDKLLVLMDGRSVYTHYFSGVYWEVQDIMLQDIKRIEVIRGPGATLWGANAVNGVINIITKSAADTQGAFMSAGGGSIEKVFAEARYGGRIGTDSYYRVYAKGFERGEFEFIDGEDAGDEWGMRQGGFRFDSRLNASDGLTVQGDVYDGDIDQKLYLPTTTPPFISTVDDETDVSGGNLLGRWQRTFSSTSDLTLMAYYDRSRRKEAWTDQERDSFDLDIQHHFRMGERNNIIWGARYYWTNDEFGNTSIITLDPTTRTDELFSVFLQDEITLYRDRLWLTLGSKFEHNDYTGFEMQPSGRLFWAAADEHKLWAAVSRAVRTPSRIESDSTLVNDVVPPSSSSPLPIALTLVGNENFEAEALIAYELGYRFLPDPVFSLDLALFYNDYDNHRSAETGTPTFQGTYIKQPVNLGNNYSTHTYGGEAAVGWQARNWLKLDLAYSYLECNFEDSNQLGRAPRHQISLRSAVKLHADVDLDVWLRYMDDATTVNVDDADYFYAIDDYLTLDLRLAWRPIPSLELSIVGQNLLDSNHLEFVQEAYSRPTDVPRSVYAKISYGF
ncbi:TonB-dependent receptor [Desulfosarcina variabilis str. Montpellier]|uniref:TonB-dependent receptor plug domain-containing protein n=1 Tax=Desulfosarcina variabilis TaxID=2300 RepID=UPI003AFB164D